MRRVGFRGLEFIPDTPKGLAEWPDCLTPDCEHKACGPLQSEYCFPCTILMRGITAEEGRAQIKSRREEVFGKECDDDQ
jgi:hypothetical protein